MGQRNREPRVRTQMRTGKVYSPQGAAICDCVIYDRSTRGARIKLPTNAKVPDLILLHDDAAEAQVLAQVRWRRNNEIGLFLPQASMAIHRKTLPPPPRPSVRHVVLGSV